MFSPRMAKIYKWLNPIWSRWSGREWVKTRTGMCALLEAAEFEVTDAAPVRYPLPATVVVARRP